jgi:hypothetical protein
VSDIAALRSTMKSPMFLLNRFKPDNLMHALHDDILPLFSRYETLCTGDVLACAGKFLLAYIDSDSGDLIFTELHIRLFHVLYLPQTPTSTGIK